MSELDPAYNPQGMSALAVSYIIGLWTVDSNVMEHAVSREQGTPIDERNIPMNVP